MPDLPKQFESKFIRKEQAAHDAWHFYFTRPSDFEFLPGQYLRIKLVHDNPDERGDSRQFTIASSPTERDHLMITTRVIQSTYKKALLNLAEGIVVEIVAPYGKFILDENERVPHVFLAGGIGITPMRSMIRYAADKTITIPITLFTSFRHTEDIIYQEELQKIAENHNWFKLVETVTRPEESQRQWTGITGRIDENLIKKYVANLDRSIFYISGPSAMVDALAETVKSLNVPAENILTEKFTGY